MFITLFPYFICKSHNFNQDGIKLALVNIGIKNLMVSTVTE